MSFSELVFATEATSQDNSKYQDALNEADELLKEGESLIKEVDEIVEAEKKEEENKPSEEQIDEAIEEAKSWGKTKCIN